MQRGFSDLGNRIKKRVTLRYVRINAHWVCIILKITPLSCSCIPPLENECSGGYQNECVGDSGDVIIMVPSQEATERLAQSSHETTVDISGIDGAEDHDGGCSSIVSHTGMATAGAGKTTSATTVRYEHHAICIETEADVEPNSIMQPQRFNESSS